MPDCRECGKQIPEGANFCPHCGGPQHERAARALESYMERRIRELSPQELEEIRVGEAGGALWSRLSYAVGWATIVVGLAMLPAIASGFVLFAGLISLPPIRRAIGRAVGGTPGVRPAALLYLTSVAIGIALFLVA